MKGDTEWHRLTLFSFPPGKVHQLKCHAKWERTGGWCLTVQSVGSRGHWMYFSWLPNSTWTQRGGRQTLVSYPNFAIFIHATRGMGSKPDTPHRWMISGSNVGDRGAPWILTTKITKVYTRWWFVNSTVAGTSGSPQSQRSSAKSNRCVWPYTFLRIGRPKYLPSCALHIWLCDIMYIQMAYTYIYTHVKVKHSTLWLFNIAMEHGPLK